MRKNIFTIAIIAIIFVFSSCDKEAEKSSTMTEEVGKIEVAYQEGTIKIETDFIPGDKKIEKEADNEYKKDIHSTLQKTISKKTTYLATGQALVGVIADGSCGQYSTFDVYMDCEDTRNTSSKSGWIGSSSVSSNVTLKFCMVYAGYFDFVTGTDYALLELSSNSVSYGKSRIIRYIDNEDNGNTNSLKVNGAVQPQDKWYGQSCFGLNTRLAFVYLPSEDATGYPTFPSLGISYGVFGRFGNNQGWIYSDDQDGNNANVCSTYRFNKNTGDFIFTDNVPYVNNILEAGLNTKLFMSKVY